ncbi:unnamed protein product (plasmid) [Mycetohabitans rhizoxinica HKI 454]|uniref:Uncharacterized protein n=1 Tax=Mycetohabitans rhizoxinica (strain DSM 19002 / CIP 109453 / HKI 454) TaxID=882378 RepID=E5AV56_MYCRK|nr:unnamed protein product [Mycetohabitans rhizoxinica HKI 454]
MKKSRFTDSQIRPNMALGGLTLKQQPAMAA